MVETRSPEGSKLNALKTDIKERLGYCTPLRPVFKTLSKNAVRLVVHIQFIRQTQASSRCGLCHAMNAFRNRPL